LALIGRLRTWFTTVAAIATGFVAMIRHGREGDGMTNELKPGDAAPDFSLQASNGRTYRLKDLAGHVVAIAWFPKAFTGG
jgi:hypothetical protein